MNPAESPHTHDRKSIPPDAQRRLWLTYSAGAVGLAAIAGASYWLQQRQANTDVANLTNDPLWGLFFPSPDGTTLHLSKHFGEPLIINFWATWCAPCIEELPLLNEFHARANGWTTIGIAVDTPANVQRFIQRFNLGFPIGIAGAPGVGIAKELGNTGGLPFTLVVDRKGLIRERKIGQIAPTDLSHWESLA
ncbi:TlpA family protein disulfide reductase [Lampropedia puyangensis]|nr:TlpA disulfide reductase family protein [Lampropedia puyangensis]